jgi:hypothetical protein
MIIFQVKPLRSVWMFVFVGLALHWLKYHYHVIFALRFNTNISVWMFRYLVVRIDIMVKYQILFGWSE